MKTCKHCKLDKDESNFYRVDSKTGRLSNYCKLCKSVRRGTENPEHLIEYLEHFDNGQIKCHTCKIVKSIDEFHKSKYKIIGYNNNCKECANKVIQSYRKKQSEFLGVYYLKSYIIENFNVKNKDITPELLEIAKLQIQIKRANKFYLDGFKNPISGGDNKHVETTLEGYDGSNNLINWATAYDFTIIDFAITP